MTITANAPALTIERVPRAEPLRTRREPKPSVVLLVAAFGAFLAFLDSTIVNVAFPDIQRTFPDSPLSTLSWVLNAYNIVLAAFLVAAGRLADLLGRKRVFIVGVVVFTLASVLCAVAGSVEQLIAFRVLQGFGAALLIPASLALVVEGFDLSHRAHAVGLWGAAAAIASGLGPPAGGALVALSSWRLAFLVNLPLGIAAVVIARRALVESRSPGVRKVPDLLGALALAAALGLLSLGLIKGPDWGWTDLRTVGSFVTSALALAGFVLSSRASRSPLLDPALLRVRSFALGNVLSIIAGAGFYAYLLTHVLYLSYVWDYSLLRAGLAVAPAAFVAAVVAAVLGKVADRRGHRIILVPGALVWAASLLWYLERVGPDPAFVTEWLPAQLIQGIGVGATLPVLGSAALARLPKGGGYATASAVVTSARQLGAVLGIALLVVLIGAPAPDEAREALRAGWVLAACCFVVVALGSALLGRTAYEGGPDVVDLRDVVPEPRPRPEIEQPVLRPVAPAAPESLADLPLFRGLSATALANLERTAAEVEVDAGEYLFRQGDPSNGLYVLRSGRLQVMQGDVVLTELARGAVLGELGVLTKDVRSASVRAVRDSRLVHVTQSQFRTFATADVMTGIAQGLARRLQEIAPPAQSRAGAAEVVIAVIGLDADAPVNECSAALVAHLRMHLRVAAPGRVDRDGLERAERDADKVVLAADGGDADWRELCLRVADRVVVVAGRPEPPAQELPARASGADLVLAGAPASRDQRASWEALLLPRSTHVVGQDVPAGLAPLSRRIAGRSIGLVLGGGGARAFAHLGVLDELEAAGIVVDRLAGSSVGACIAGMSAMGMDAAAVDALAYEHFVRSNPLGDYTLPTKGLIRGRRTVAAIERACADHLVEDLPKEFRCVSVDLLRRRKVVHRSGRLADALACSLRLPGLYPPLPHNGTLHVDGGVLDNLPVFTLSRDEGPLVAVSISFGGSRPAGAPHRTGPPRVPALGDTLMRTMMLGSGDAAEHAFSSADLVLRPDSAGVGLLEFHQIDRMREVGREAVREALPQLVALSSR